MPSQEVLNMIVSFLGGGTVVGILSWIKSSVSERRLRRADCLIQQLTHFYAPLFFFTSQNEELFRLNSELQKAYSVEYEGKHWSQDEVTQSTVHEEAKKTLEIANDYISSIERNNKRIAKIIMQNYVHIDPDDIVLCKCFLVYHIRLATERDQGFCRNLPFRIHQHVGDISFMRAELIERVRLKFTSKKKELEEIRTGWL
jgi:hypothetical protein